ncbi:MAG: ABC transporter permease, partial [Mesorhizobium sp.]
MTIIIPDIKPAAVPGSGSVLLAYLKRDRLALAAAIFLAIVVIAAVLGPWLVGDAASRLGLRQRNLAPFSLASGWIYILGADTLGRPILAR